MLFKRRDAHQWRKLEVAEVDLMIKEYREIAAILKGEKGAIRKSLQELSASLKMLRKHIKDKPLPTQRDLESRNALIGGIQIFSKALLRKRPTLKKEIEDIMENEATLMNIQGLATGKYTVHIKNLDGKQENTLEFVGSDGITFGRSNAKWMNNTVSRKHIKIEPIYKEKEYTLTITGQNTTIIVSPSNRTKRFSRGESKRMRLNKQYGVMIEYDHKVYSSFKFLVRRKPSARVTAESLLRR